MGVHKFIVTNPVLNWYINLFCNRLQKLPNGEYCDSCWAWAMIVSHFLLGLNVILGVIAILVFVGLKIAFPTEYDQGADESVESTS